MAVAGADRSPPVEVSLSLRHSGLEMVTLRLASRVHALSRNYPAQSSRNGGRQHIGAHLHVRASSQHVKHFRRRAKPDREVKLIQIGAAQRILLDLYSRAPPCVFPRFSGSRNSEVRLCSVISETPRMTPLHESSLCKVSELLVPMSSIACCLFSRGRGVTFTSARVHVSSTHRRPRLAAPLTHWTTPTSCGPMP